MSVWWSLWVDANTPTFVAPSDDGAVVMSVDQTLRAVRGG